MQIKKGKGRTIIFLTGLGGGGGGWENCLHVKITQPLNPHSRPPPPQKNNGLWFFTACIFIYRKVLNP